MPKKRKEPDPAEYEGWNMEPPTKDPEAVKRGKKSKRKGKTGEREVVNLAKSHGFEARRLAPIQARAGNECPDVEAWLIDFEVKLQKRPNIMAAYRQASANRRSGQYPVAATRADREEWLATLSLEDFLWLLDAARKWMERA